MPPFTQRWFNLVTETQLATDLILTGLRRMSRLPMNGGLLEEISYDQTYPLYMGLHTYTSGLERLCKLTLACEGFIRTGTFTPVKSYSHKLTALLDKIAGLHLPGDDENREQVVRPSDSFGPRLELWLEKYASGSGRYELLDSLSADQAGVEVWSEWLRFCDEGQGLISNSVRDSISLNYASFAALGRIATAHDLESVASPILNTATLSLSEEAAPVIIALYSRARWVAEWLNKVSYYTHEDLPILGEALIELRQTDDNFYAFEIAQLSDPDVVGEEIAEFNEKFVSDSDDDW